MKYVLLFLVTFSSAYRIKTNKKNLRIIGGRNASADEFPYVVRIMMRNVNKPQLNYFLCSSVVLTSTWTLSAAHCILRATEEQSPDDSNKLVIEYHRSPDTDPAFSDVQFMVAHPRFTIGANDVGLLNTQPVVITTYAKISPLDYSSLLGHKVTLVGYGSDEQGLSNDYHLPRVLEVVVKFCDHLIHYPEMCFAPPCSPIKPRFRALCSGDSGGPVIHPTGVVAINSMGDRRDCGKFSGEASRKNRYDEGYNIGTSTPLSPFVDWISSTMKKENV